MKTEFCSQFQDEQREASGPLTKSEESVLVRRFGRFEGQGRRNLFRIPAVILSHPDVELQCSFRMFLLNKKDKQLDLKVSTNKIRNQSRSMLKNRIDVLKP
jgi:hypothetical protein